MSYPLTRKESAKRKATFAFVARKTLPPVHTPFASLEDDGLIRSDVPKFSKQPKQPSLKLTRNAPPPGEGRGTR